MKATINESGEEQFSFFIPDWVVLPFLPLLTLVTLFTPKTAGMRVQLNDRVIIIRPLWRVLYGYYRRWRMGRFKAKL